MNASIQIEKLSKKYINTDVFAVDNIDLTIKSGEIFGILGPNGAGKTTLISMLCGLIKPTSGNIKIAGKPLKTNKKITQQIIGVVPQEYALYPMLTAFENLVYFGAMYGLKGKDLKLKINNALSELGLSKFKNQKVKTFSGGMKRRVNLIAGILHNPAILYLDEPTVGVDVQSKNVIINHLKELNKRETTIIYTSHHMVEAQNFCDRVAIIDSGRIIALDSPSKLIENTKDAKRLEDVYLNLTGENLRDNV